MSTTTTPGKNALLAGLKAQMEAAGAAPSAVLVYLAGATVIASQNVSAAVPASGQMTLTSVAGTTSNTGTITSAELRDRAGVALRTYTVGASGSGRDIILSVSGSGVNVSGSDIVVTLTGVTVGIASIVETSN